MFKQHSRHVICNLCGSGDASLLYKASSMRRIQSGEFNLMKCRKCGLIYTNPRLSSDAVATYYPQDYEYHEPRKANFLEKLFYKYFHNPGTKKGRILDVGCGNGNYLCMLRKIGWDCYGTEINKPVVDYMINKLGLKISEGELYNIIFPDEYFDVITFWGSLEHMSDPREVLTKAYKILKKNGKIIIWLPNIESLEAKIFRKFWHHLEISTHYYQFSPKTLTNLLEQIGFKVERIRFDPISMGIIPSLGYALTKIGIKINLNKLPLKILFIPLDVILALFKQSGLITVYAKK